MGYIIDTMARKIKFRAWNKKDKYWMTDTFYVRDDGRAIHFNWDDPRGDIELNQFTGLRDKNGKEIYEGDRVRRYMYSGWEEYPRGVNWDVHNACWNDGNNQFVFAGVYEILGNIYEKQELPITKH